MTDSGPSPDQPSSEGLWRYQFSRPDETVVETGAFHDDGAAEDRARELSRENDTPVVVHRHSAHVDGWDYVTEVDRRT